MNQQFKNKFRNIKSPYILILVGHPLSGKGTFCKYFTENIDDNITIISRDDIVMSLHGDDNYSTAFKTVDQKKVDKILINTIEKSAANEHNVIIDMTNMSRKRRVYNLSFYGENYYKIAIVFPILSEVEYDKRNKKRHKEENKSIANHIVRNMINSYQPVDKNEGFDKIISIN